MKYLKLFDTESNYLAYRDGSDYLKPNVSLSDYNGEVYYNYLPPDFNGHDYVDLGLPSGTLWATMNVGASKPSDYGLYFQWGDTQGYTAAQVGIGDGKKKFASDWSDYKWRLSGDSFDNVAFTKYTNLGETLELEDDAAYANMGGDWHMPTFDQIWELISHTTTAWTTSDGVSGMTFTSHKDKSKSIFIPNAGFARNGTIVNSGKIGCLWSSMVSRDDIYECSTFEIASYGAVISGGGNRYEGQSVRGVIG